MIMVSLSQNELMFAEAFKCKKVKKNLI